MSVAGRHDHAERRATVRRGRERGCWLYVPAHQLAKAGFSSLDAPPYSRTWAGPRGRIVVQLYREK